jgi:hypothetical protein
MYKSTMIDKKPEGRRFKPFVSNYFENIRLDDISSNSYQPPLPPSAHESEKRREPDPAQELFQYSFEALRARARSSVIDYLKRVVKISSITQATFQNIEAIEATASLEELLDSLFKLISSIV